MEDQICRICLGDGDIPIYGEKDDSRIAEEIRIFGDICLDKYDDTPKHICETCYQLLQSAVVFRTLAKETQSYMEEPVSDEDNFQESDSDNNALDRIDQSELLQNSEDNEMLFRNLFEKIFNRVIEMTTWYYWSKAQKAKRSSNNNIHDYYTELPEALIKTKDDIDSKCRVCLQKGTFAIFESEDENSEEVVEALRTFGDIFVSNQDEYPKLLCKTCYNFIKTAILFRKTAKKAEEILRQPLKEETYLDPGDSHHSFSDNELSEIKPSEFKWPENNEVVEEKVETIKKEKAEKNKNPPKITCNVCNKIINKSYYREHMTLHDSDQKKFVCDICGKSFRLRCAYRNHSIRHRNDFPHKCSFCPYRGRYAELLKTHMRTHTGDYRYMCTECPARFLFKSNLNSHMFKHKEPQHKCDTCKRAFHTTLALQRHFEADHLGIKNHVCNICGKAFGYRNAMMKHQRRVHKREKQLFGRMPSYLVAEKKKQDANML